MDIEGQIAIAKQVRKTGQLEAIREDLINQLVLNLKDSGEIRKNLNKIDDAIIEIETSFIQCI